MAEILNPDHSDVTVFKESRRRWLAVATYRGSGVRAVILRKEELFGEERVAVLSEFVVSTADNDDHLKALMKYCATMILDHHLNN